MIRALNYSELREAVASALAVPTDRTVQSLIRPALRRAAFHLAPASWSELVRFTAEPLEALGVTRDSVEEALDELIVYGDLIEMRRLGSDPWDAPASVIRPAPPSFVARPDGTIVILGVAGELPSALTPGLEDRIDAREPVRTLQAKANEKLAARLKQLGLIQLSEIAWLRAPRTESAEAHLGLWRKRLASIPITAGGVPDLEILDPSRRVRFYKGRWTTSKGKFHGLRLARRPQNYGAPLWTIAEFHDGVALRVIDLFESEDRQRPQDLGWRFQAALDATLGHPQEVQLRRNEDRAVLDFFSPLPAFAERRLALVGMKTTGQGRIFSFEMTEQAATLELANLQQTMWMRPVRQEDAR